MKFDDKQTKVLLDKIQSYWKGNCSICGSNDWAVSDRAFRLDEFFGDLIPTSSAQVPVVTVTCGKCGNTHLANLIHLGLVDKTTGGWING